MIAAVLALVMVILAAARPVGTSISGEEAAQALQTADIGAPLVILGVVMILVTLVSYFMNLIGIMNASKDEAGFKRALWVLLASMVFCIAGAALENSSPRLANWLNVPSTLFELVVTLFVLEGIGNLANNLGKKQIADMSAQCRTYILCALVLSAAAEIFVALGNTGTALNTTSGIAAALLQIVAYVVYLRVLNKARLMQ